MLPEDSRIVTLHFISIDSTHSSYLLIHKRPVNNLFHYIQNCKFPFRPRGTFVDSGFDFIIPRSLTHIIYTNGDNNFAFRFDDAGNHTTIEIFYDFDGSYKQSFLNSVKSGKQAATAIELEGKICWLYKNWQGRSVGSIFLENNTLISYYTDNLGLENELCQTIVKFRWK